MVEVKLRELPASEHVLLFDDEGVARLDLAFGSRQVRRVIIGASTTERPEPGPLPPRPLAWSLRLEGASSTTISPIQAPTVTSYFSGPGLSGTVTCGGLPAAGAEIEVVEVSADGQERTYRTVTDAQGNWFLYAEPEMRSTYTAIVSDPLLTPVSAGPVEIRVALEVSLVVSDPRPALGEPLHIDGRTFPAHDGAQVTLEFRRPERPWRTGAVVRTGPGGDYATDIVLPRPGVWELRVRAEPGDGDHEANDSVIRTVVVERP